MKKETKPIFQCWYHGFWFSTFCVFPSEIHTLLLETLRRKIPWKILHIFLCNSLTEKRIGAWHHLFWGKDINEKNNIFGIFLLMFPKKNIYFWIQQFHFGRKQKDLWKRCYTVKKPLKNRTINVYVRQNVLEFSWINKLFP